MSSSPVPGAGGAASEHDAGGGGFREPLLANGCDDVDGGFHDGALAAVVVANSAHGGGSRAKEKNAVKKAKDGYWVDVHHRPAVADVESGGGDRPLLFSNKKVTAALLYPYRVLILVRLVAVILFIAWRIKHNNSDVMWFWATSVVGDVWFALSWLLYQLPKLSPIKRTPDLAALRRHYDDLPDGGGSILPGIDVFVTTADPVSEPVLYTMNCVLSILATDYPVDRLTCYLTDDSGALVLYEALVEAASFAALWAPFCRKHSVEPRAPESYFQLEGMIYNGRSPGEFMNDYRHVQREYEELKARLEMLPSTIKERSDVYNSMKAKEGGAHATWMANGTQWPGTWIEPAENHRKGDHAGIVKIVQSHPSSEAPPPAEGGNNNNMNPLNFDGVDTRVPMVVYVSREKSPGREHNKKAGNLNAQLRVSALLSNAPFTINFDCDHYINNSQALRAAMCFMLDAREGDSTGFVQFPQRFQNVDPTDRYGNHNRVFFDGAMYALNGLQGPTYLGTGCMFRRLALYGVDPPPPRRSSDVEEHGHGGVTVDIDTNKFGNSVLFLNSVLAALKQERRIAPPELDEAAFLAEMTMVVSSSYDQGTDWGSSVGYIYNIATEDIVTGYRIHGQGWRSMYCSMEREAFQGTAPINLTERLYQIVRWSGGSMEVFFSPYNPLLSGRRTTAQCISTESIKMYREQENGPSDFTVYKERWMAAHPGQECNDFGAFCMAHKGKYSSNVTYSLNDPPTAYSNPNVYKKVHDYTAAAQKVHGPDFDPFTQPIDPEVVMAVGGGKKHGRLWIADSCIDSSGLSLSKIRSESATSGLTIRTRPSPAQTRVDELQARLEESERQRQADAAAFRAQQETQAKQLAELMNFLQTSAPNLPASLLAAFAPPQPTPPASAGSNPMPPLSPDVQQQQPGMEQQQQPPHL